MTKLNYLMPLRNETDGVHAKCTSHKFYKTSFYICQIVGYMTEVNPTLKRENGDILRPISLQ